MINAETIDNAVNKHYTAFSKEIKATLHSKLANHEISKTYAAEVDKIHDLKDTFKQINNPEE